MKQFVSCLIYILLLNVGSTAADQPFSISAFLTSTGESEVVLSVVVKIPPRHFLYMDQFKVEVPESIELIPRIVPVPEKKKDVVFEEEKAVYSRDFMATYRVGNLHSNKLPVTVRFQGCRENICLLPESKSFVLSLEDQRVERHGALSSLKGDAHAADSRMEKRMLQDDWQSMMRNFTIVAKHAGYLNANDFLKFLDLAETGTSERAIYEHGVLQRLWSHGSIWILLMGILLGGLALNLTPCVLPVIPVTVAIIGAGAQSGSRVHGFILGALYGGGIAIAYGCLGLIVVLTGSRFGAINASPWFNISIAVIFFILSLAIFNVFFIDLSRFRKRTNGTRPSHTGKSVWRSLTVFVMGMISALLAGACVAPVVIFVLLYSADQYSKGNIAGLFLPFLLGIGMALPWPFAGAGLSFLPRPGKWMERVKIAFGIMILVTAAFYGYSGIKILMNRWSTDAPSIKTEIGMDLIQEKTVLENRIQWVTSLSDAMILSDREKKPIFINFCASWCKSCHAMDITTFRALAVRQRLRNFVAVKYRAERPNQSPFKQVLDAFGVMGLPTYVILRPK